MRNHNDDVDGPDEPLEARMASSLSNVLERGMIPPSVNRGTARSLSSSDSSVNLLRSIRERESLTTLTSLPCSK